MAPLLRLDAARVTREVEHADAAEAAARGWRRSWRRVSGECLGCALAGYALYGSTFGLTDAGMIGVLIPASYVVSFVLPLARLLVFLVRHGDQF